MQSAPSEVPAAAAGPLSGVRILDFTHMVAGPYLTLQMAYLGADVVKVESRSRIDGWRVRNGNRDVELSWPFADHNKGKRSITLDLKHPGAREVVLALARRCDAVTENFSAGVMERLGIGYDDLRGARPDLIMVRLPAMGLSGPRRGWVAWGPNLMAYCGFTHLWNHPGAAAPVGSQTSYLDYVNGLHGATALLGALLWRDRTGEGSLVEVAQADTSVSLLAPALISHLLSGSDPTPQGNAQPSAVPGGCYRCAGEDRWIAVAVRTDSQWASLLGVMGRPAWLAAEHGALEGRAADRDRIEAAMRAFAAGQERDDLLRRLRAAGVPAAPVADGETLAGDPGLRAAGFVEEIEHPRMGRRLFPSAAMRLSATPVRRGRRAPLLGEHSAAVLRDLLGVSPEQIAAWESGGLLRWGAGGRRGCGAGRRGPPAPHRGPVAGAGRPAEGGLKGGRIPMDFARTAEEEALVGSLRETLQQCCTPAHLRAWEEAGASCDAAFVKAVAAGGFLEVGLPWGPAPGTVPLALLAEESGRFLAPPLLALSAGYAAFALGEHPLARRVAAGEVCAAPPPGRARVAAARAGGAPGLRLSGRADGLALLDRAAFILLEVDDGGVPALACLRPAAPGVAAEPVAMQSGAPLWRLRLDGAAPEEVLAVPAARLAAAADRWRTCVAAWSAGAGARAVELAVAHASSRRQFGHPVGSYQSVQNRLVDAAVLLEEARMLTCRAAALLDAGAVARTGDATPAGVLPRLARRLAGQAFQQAARAATLTFGGYGFIVDSDIQLYYRRGKDEQLRFEPPALHGSGDLPLPPFQAAEAPEEVQPHHG